MDSEKRIIVNTVLQYVKAIITTCLSLYSTRIILNALDVDDFGVYSVIAGVVAMLGFITNALIITTQRFLSYYSSKKDTTQLRKLFVNSLFIHVVFGLLISLVLLLLKDVLFDSILNINSARRPVAEIVYVITIGMLLATILTSPFKALFIAHEKIVFIAIVEIIDSVVKLLLAFGLAYVSFDRLLAYAWMMGLIVALNLIVFSAYALYRFPECQILFRRKDLSKTYIKMITGFAGWTTYGMGCVAARNQGIAVVLNHFWGTAINAAYGIAYQINGAISFLVTSILNAMNPQLMQAEGKGDRKKMLDMAARQSKFSVTILAVVIIPLIAEMPAILNIWLKEVPVQTDMFCRFILLAFLFDQITLGLSSANQAIGNIRVFTLLTYTPKLIYVAIAWLMFKHGLSIRSVMVLYVVVELVVALARIPYMHFKTGLSIWGYIRDVIVPTTLHCIVIGVICYVCTTYLHFHMRFLLTILFSALFGIAAGWLLVMNKEEKSFATILIKNFLKR